MKNNLPPSCAHFLALALISLTVPSLSGCLGGSSSSNGGDSGDSGTGGSPTGGSEIETAAEIYDGDYSGPEETANLDTPEAAAKAMDLAYLVSRTQAILFTLERLVIEFDPDDTPVTIDGDVGGPDDAGTLIFESTMTSSGFEETWTMEGENGFCTEKMDTDGPICLKGSVSRSDEPSEATSETVFEELKATFRGGKVEMTGLEVSFGGQSEDVSVSYAADILFTSDASTNEPGNQTEIRALRDERVENPGDPQNFSRTVSMQIATPLLGGQIQAEQSDTMQEQETFDQFSCSDGLFGATYQDASSGRVSISHQNQSIVANLSESGACQDFVVSGGQSGTFTLLESLFDGP